MWAERKEGFSYKTSSSKSEIFANGHRWPIRPDRGTILDLSDRKRASLWEEPLVVPWRLQRDLAGLAGRQSGRAGKGRVAWTLVGVVGIDPGEAVAAG